MTVSCRLARCIYSSIVVVLCLIPAGISASNLTKTVAHYKVTSSGITIGNVTTTQHMTEEGNVTRIDFETRTAVNASFLWMGFHLDTVENGTLLKGNLVNYFRKGRNNGIAVDIEGRLDHATFRFEVHEQGATRTLAIPRESYDYTTMECPEAQLDFSDKTQVTLRVLDVEKMAVVKRDYRLVRNARYRVAEKEYPCRIVDFTDRNKNARRWISYDGSAVVVYRQDGNGEKNSYSVQATSVTRGL